MTTALTIENLHKIYNNGTVALKGIHFSVEKGDFFALLGPNGAGKSTTIGIMTSLTTKSAGTVKIFGYNLDRQPNEAKIQVGLVPQEFNFNIFETPEQILINQAGYYGVPRSIAKKRCEKYLTRMGLWKKRKMPARSLSGGMKRRLMIARGLVHEPQLLILDEPTAGVDIELRRSLWHFIKEINNEGVTIILTTHYLEEAESLCKNIAIIHHGEIIENLPKKILLDKLKNETFVLFLKEPLSFVPSIPDFNLKLMDSYTLEAQANEKNNLNLLFQHLSENNIIVSSLRNKTNRLEKLFLQLTGHQDEQNES